MIKFKNNIFKKYFEQFDIVLIFGLIFGAISSLLIYITNDIFKLDINMSFKLLFIIFLYLFVNLFLFKYVLINKYQLEFNFVYKNIINYFYTIIFTTLVLIGAFGLLIIPFFIIIPTLLILPIAYIDQKNNNNLNICSTLIFIETITKGIRIKLLLSFLLQIIIIIPLIIIGYYFYIFNLHNLNIFIKNLLLYSYIFTILSIIIIYQIDTYIQLSSLVNKKISQKKSFLYKGLLGLGIIFIITFIMLIKFIDYSNFNIDKKLDSSKRVMGLNTIQILLENYYDKHGTYPDKNTFKKNIIDKSDKNFKIIGSVLNIKNNLTSGKCNNGFEYFYNINKNNQVLEYKLTTCLYEKNNYSENDNGIGDFIYEISNKEILGKHYSEKIKIYDL